MIIQDKVLTLTRFELIDIIQNHPDPSDRNSDIGESLLRIICKKRYFTASQYDWILLKVQHILSRNREYREKQGLKNARFEDFWIWPDLWPILPH
jgi:hypothetical protein